MLAKYFENDQVFPKNYFEGKRVIELGAGCGLVGLTLGTQKAHVWLTDLAPIVKLLQRNIVSNHMEENVHTCELAWYLYY